MNSLIIEQLNLGKRIDGRDPLQQRDLDCQFGPQSTGAVELTLGNTRVFATTSAQITTPNPIRPSEGFLRFHIDLQVLRDIGHTQNPQKLSMEIEKYIERVIKGSKALDTESLCILSGKNVWSIDVNVVLINNDGNLIDSMYMCSMFSLQHFRRPQVSVSTQGVRIEEEKRLVPLSIHHIPLSLTYAIIELNDQTVILQDPNNDEELIQNGRITFSVNIYNDICHVHKPGGSPINIEILNKLTTATLMKSNEYTQQIRNYLKSGKGFTYKDQVNLYCFELPKVEGIQIEQLEQFELKKVVDSQFNYERRKYIFWAFNTSYLGIAFFQIYSDVVIEGGENPALCVDTALINHDLQCPIGLYKTLVALIVAHLFQMLSATIGYFGIDQKSRKINKSYSILLIGSYFYNLITSFILWFSYDTWQDTPFRNTQNEFLMLSIFFPALMAIVGFYCLNQFKKATYENAQMQLAKEELLDRHPQIAQDVVKLFL